MPTAGQRLATVQYRTHLVIDAIYQPLPERVEAIVLRYARLDTEGVARVPREVVPAIARDVGMVISGIEPELTRAVLASVREVERVTDPDSVPSELVLVGALEATRQSLQANRPSVTSQVARLVTTLVAGTHPAAAIARAAAQYFAPFFAPRRDARGTVRRGNTRPGATQSWPGRAGMASQHVRLIMLTETTAGHDRAIRRLAGREDQLLRYHVSHKHLESDICDVFERRDVGFGIGVYDPDDAPMVPTHFRCRCYYELARDVPFLAKSETAT